MLRIVYRVCHVENAKPRPAWYSKRVCLASLADARRGLKESSLLVLSDGPLASEIAELIGDTPVTFMRGRGNSESFLDAFSIAAAWPEEDVAYFVEDDYLHLPDALVKLDELFADVACDYVTLYDHPDRYRSPDRPDADLPLHRTESVASRSHTWMPVESTCMTFAARIRAIREDFGVFLTHVRRGEGPHDRRLFRHLQGLGPYEVTGLRRTLLGARPSLATHCESAFLAPGVDWKSAAERVGAACPR